MPGLAEAFERVGSFLEHRLPLMNAPGAALAVTDREELLGVVVRGFADAGSGAPVRPQTRFQIGSISKSFAAIVALQEVEAGRLDLHTPVTELVPWVALPQPFAPITMHHLLSHTSGLATGIEDVLEAPSAVWNLRLLSPGFPPGERFWYSNDAYKLVGLVLERVSGQPPPRSRTTFAWTRRSATARCTRTDPRIESTRSWRLNGSLGTPPTVASCRT
jgi:D-alanyl-D-alanine carboxypeptidase